MGVFSRTELVAEEGSETGVEDAEEDAETAVLRRSELARVRDFSDPVSPSDSNSSLSLSVVPEKKTNTYHNNVTKYT